MLRVIQEKTIRSVGETQTQAVDFRLVAATNKNLVEEVREKRFREDLFYRLSPVTLTLPPLRDRKGDIPLIAMALLTGMQSTMSEKLSLDDRTLQIMEAYEWPGNVRELGNVLRGASIFAEEGVILPDNLPVHIKNQNHTAKSKESITAGYSLAEYELEAICNALNLSDNNRKKAAQLLKISEATLYRKIKQYEL